MLLSLSRAPQLVSLASLVRRLIIQAEAVSLSLSAPILIHPRPKPGCSKTVLSYFQGELGQPTTLRGQLRLRASKLKEEEEGDEDIVVGKWKDEINGPILGPLIGRDGKPIHDHDREKRDLSGDKDNMILPPPTLGPLHLYLRQRRLNLYRLWRELGKRI
jgi:hypothetical protein